MMIVRRREERGHFDHGWLDTSHSFSFADYYDPAHMGFRALRVINEDRVAPGRGFGAHSHRDMEIVTYVLEGALEHKDSLGTGSVIRPGEVQRMSAGRGISHSEFNHSRTEPVHFLQIWIVPATRGLPPSYEQRDFAERLGTLQVVAAPEGSAADAVTLHQDVMLLAGRLGPGAAAEHRLAPGRHAWVQLARGTAIVNGESLRAGDGAALSEVDGIALSTPDGAEVLVFDLA